MARKFNTPHNRTPMKYQRKLEREGTPRSAVRMVDYVGCGKGRPR